MIHSNLNGTRRQGVVLTSLPFLFGSCWCIYTCGWNLSWLHHHFSHVFALFLSKSSSDAQFNLKLPEAVDEYYKVKAKVSRPFRVQFHSQKSVAVVVVVMMMVVRICVCVETGASARYFLCVPCSSHNHSPCPPLICHSTTV